MAVLLLLASKASGNRKVKIEVRIRENVMQATSNFRSSHLKWKHEYSTSASKWHGTTPFVYHYCRGTGVTPHYNLARY